MWEVKYYETNWHCWLLFPFFSVSWDLFIAGINISYWFLLIQIVPFVPLVLWRICSFKRRKLYTLNSCVTGCFVFVYSDKNTVLYSLSSLLLVLLGGKEVFPAFQQLFSERSMQNYFAAGVAFFCMGFVVQWNKTMFVYIRLRWKNVQLNVVSHCILHHH